MRGRITLGQKLLRDGAAAVNAHRTPSDFRSFVSRRATTRFVGFPESWRDAERPSPDGRPAVVVVVHVFYADLLPGILAELRHVPESFDLVVTVTEGVEVDVAAALRELGLDLLRETVVLRVENRGRDILPLVSVVNAGLLDGYDAVLKVHTKRSAWRADHEQLAGSGGAWRDELVGAVLPSREGAARVLRALRTTRAGLVTSGASIVGAEHWGADRELVVDLLRRLELDDLVIDLRFPAGSIWWGDAFVVRGLRALRLERDDFPDEDGAVDGTTAHAVERLLGILAIESGMTVSAVDELEGLAVEETHDVRVVPFYLPQFHTFPENDRWWGTGFTEWTNVSRAVPDYEGHAQPMLPGQLGFYDLHRDEVRNAQHDLARRAGVAGFMYYHYWFAGGRLMDMPLERLAASDLAEGFCVMWANEDWTRTWDGRGDSVLIAQDYDAVPAEDFIEHLLPLMRDDRWLRIGGSAVLAVYRPAHLPDHRAAFAHWRRRAEEAGVGSLHLLGVDVGTVYEGLGSADLAGSGLDGLMGFPPHNHEWHWQERSGLGVRPEFEGRILSYRGMADGAVSRLRLPQGTGDVVPTVMAGFDNTARRQLAPDIWYGANPFTFRRWLAEAAESVTRTNAGDPVVFVNAWNEWAEGAVLEPTDRWGSTYLDAVATVTRPRR
ncbi:glycoside hydrolase family 99-like domain-containing protein [Frigoribacterium sp. VKM Ac-2530]|uniref:glycoside hydrolase family 99-like domain-containing protein n=1 Tax=Frigoribacterium sp. VKM Ac-2530 TaxID=2783822 RepID=UPI00188C4204|nr:glycoside hydrolase family 99-like domain-containing protein [Frigoribacterium sp. VKM Ac-2530]MBF4578836.1 glycoside hydrolase family 99-like domain-containing protein [Frigoribacterium sp. VKM Ac-2530]